MRTVLFVISTLIFAMPLYAAELTAADKKVEGPSITAQGHVTATLRARPRLCMTERADRSCIMEVELSWTASQKDNFCIYTADNDTAIACWDAAEAGEKIVPVNSPKDINYLLFINQSLFENQSTAKNQPLSKNQSIAKKVAEVTVSILNVKPNSLKQNRRRRHAWSIF